uniref:DUF3456 domain-containing protein n=1 Tax=Graphocephala atropunctata TaxID=36148 RepID=A0A1B6K9Z0_9HEMI
MSAMIEFSLVFIFHVIFHRDCYAKFTTADYLESLDHLICGQITQPSLEDCERLYDHLDRYYDCLLGLLESLRQQDPYTGEAIAHYWALGEPEFAKDYDVEVYKKLENIMRATDREMSLFFEKVEKIKGLWEEFKEECEKNKYYCEPSPVLFS